MRLVKFRDTSDDLNESAYGILVEDEENKYGNGGDFIICLCCLRVLAKEEYEIIEDNVVCPTSIDTLLKKELEE